VDSERVVAAPLRPPRTTTRESESVWDARVGIGEERRVGAGAAESRVAIQSERAQPLDQPGGRTA
jgi:hypothetical protein